MISIPSAIYTSAVFAHRTFLGMELDQIFVFLGGKLKL